MGLEGKSSWLTSFGMVTCVVMTGPPMSLYEPLLPAEQCEGERFINLSLTALCQKNKRSLQVRKQQRDNKNPSPLTRLKVLPGRIAVFENSGNKKVTNENTPRGRRHDSTQSRNRWRKQL